mgnify:CR=1 FL=1
MCDRRRARARKQGAASARATRARRTTREHARTTPNMSTKAFMGFGAVALLYYFFGMGPAAPTSRVSLADATSSTNPTVYFDITLDGVVKG